MKKKNMKTFRFLCGDVSFTLYGGKWYRRIGLGIYHVIELRNLKEDMGGETRYTYYVSLDEVNLNIASEEQIRAALYFCGLENMKEIDELMLVESLHSYGAIAPLMDWAGNNWKKLMKLAKDYSKKLEQDLDEYEKVLERPVNRLGMTAREYQQGDMISAFLRGLEAGDKVVWLLARIYGVNEEELLEAGYKKPL